MKIIDIYNKEHSRTSNNIIFLYKDDKGGWIHGYEWSAYLSRFYNNGLNDNERLKPTRRKIKEVEDGIISIGLLPSSIDKYFPKSNIISNDDTCMQIEVNLEDYDSPQDIDDILSQWKNEYQIKSPQKTAQKSFIVSRPSTFSGIMKRIIGYQLESSTPNDNLLFIRELKNMCTELI